MNKSSKWIKALLMLGFMVLAGSVYAEADHIAWLQRADQLSKQPIALVFLVLLLLTFISEDLTCAVAGLLVARGNLGLTTAILSCASGIFIGDIILVMCGRLVNDKTLTRFPFRLMINKKRLLVAKDWFLRRGPAVIFFSRFVPGSRLPTYLTVGFLRLPLWRFSIYFIIAATVWTPLLVILSWKLGKKMLPLIEQYNQLAPILLCLLIVGMVVLLKILLPAISHEGRRLLQGRWNRIRRWEFWPLYIFYLPIILYILYLGIRHRCVTLFTLANPFLEDGGFVGESKSEILKSLPEEIPEILPWLFIPKSLPQAERILKIDTLINEHPTPYPVAIKPDKGERGAGVFIARNREQAQQYLKQAEEDTLVQAYADGAEFGVFYIRYPHQEKGMIFSITRKRLLHLIGDGKKNLKRLILDHPRAVSQAKIHLDRWSNHLFDVPKEGQNIPLTELGSHCRGAIFENGSEFITPELTDCIDEISKRIEGFYFGRYDIRVPSESDLAAGKNLKIIELNGVSSEATHIYDRDISLLEAYKILFKQWKHAFAIGAEIRKTGKTPLTVRNLWRRIRQIHILEIDYAAIECVDLNQNRTPKPWETFHDTFPSVGKKKK